MHSSDTALLHFDNVRVPGDNIIGEEGKWTTNQMKSIITLLVNPPFHVNARDFQEADSSIKCSNSRKNESVVLS